MLNFYRMWISTIFIYTPKYAPSIITNDRNSAKMNQKYLNKSEE